MARDIRQRLVRTFGLIGGTAGLMLLVAGDWRAVTTPGVLAVLVGVGGWTVVENIVLRTDEPRGRYHGKRWTRILMLAVAATSVLAAVQYFHGPDLLALPRTVATSLVGLAIVVAGAAVRLWAILHLAEHFRYELRVVQDQRLVDTGPFRFVRHPSYLGLWIIGWGQAIAMASGLAAVIGAAVLFWLLVRRIRTEEEILGTAFGASYERYRARTWALVPGVY